MNNFIEIVKNNFLSFFIMDFTYFIYDYLYFYILTKYTPIHTKICEYFSIIVYWFYEGSYNIPAIFIIIYNIISSMIYLEIIEHDFCEFNKDIKLKIIIEVMLKPINKKKFTFNFQILKLKKKKIK